MLGDWRRKDEFSWLEMPDGNFKYFSRFSSKN